MTPTLARLYKSWILSLQSNLHILNALPPKSFSLPKSRSPTGLDSKIGSPRASGLSRGLKKVLSGWKDGSPALASETSGLAPIPSEEHEHTPRVQLPASNRQLFHVFTRMLRQSQWCTCEKRKKEMAGGGVVAVGWERGKRGVSFLS